VESVCLPRTLLPKNGISSRDGLKLMRTNHDDFSVPILEGFHTSTSTYVINKYLYHFSIYESWKHYYSGLCDRSQVGCECPFNDDIRFILIIVCSKKLSFLPNERLIWCVINLVPNTVFLWYCQKFCREQLFRGLATLWVGLLHD